MPPPRVSIVRDWSRRPPRGGVAVVIDVLRFSTTLCSLVRAGRRRIRVARDPQSLQQTPGIDYADVFSELDFAAKGRRFDNSPHQAIAARAPGRAAFVTTTTGSRAAFASRGARRVLIGCFANFEVLIRRLSRVRGAVRLVPAATAAACPGSVEDECCASAIVEALRGDPEAGGKALARLRQSPRVAQFLRARPRWGHEDLAYCLNLNRLPVLPELVFGPGREPVLARVRPTRKPG